MMAGVILVAGGAAVAAVLLGGRAGVQLRPGVGGDPPLRSSRVQQISDGLRSGTPAGMAGAVALPAGTEPSAAALQSFKRLGSVSLNLASFHDHGDGTASIQITVMSATGAKQGWAGTLVVVHGRWKLAASSRL